MSRAKSITDSQSAMLHNSIAMARLEAVKEMWISENEDVLEECCIQCKKGMGL